MAIRSLCPGPSRIIKKKGERSDRPVPIPKNLASPMVLLRSSDNRASMVSWIAGPPLRYPASRADATGAIERGPGEIVALSAGAIGPGETWHFQAVYRDPGGSCGSSFNSSNAVSVSWEP